MKSEYLETLNNLFSENSPPTEKVIGLMDETMAFFNQIKSKLESNDPEKQKEALEETMEMKRILDAKIKLLTEKTGLDVSQLAALAENPENMSPEERSAYENAKERLMQMQEQKPLVKNRNLKPQKIIG